MAYHSCQHASCYEFQHWGVTKMPRPVASQKLTRRHEVRVEGAPHHLSYASELARGGTDASKEERPQMSPMATGLGWTKHMRGLGAFEGHFGPNDPQKMKLQENVIKLKHGSNKVFFNSNYWARGLWLPILGLQYLRIYDAMTYKTTWNGEKHIVELEGHFLASDRVF